MSETNDIMKNIISLDEVGVDTSEYQISTDVLSDTSYTMYCNLCQSEERMKFDYSTDYVIGERIGQLTAAGRMGVFRWYALTTYYGKDIYKMNDERTKQNIIHRKTMQKGSYGLGELLNHALNISYDMHSFLREPIVLNTGEIADVHDFGFLTALQRHLEIFMELPHEQVTKKHNNVIEYDLSLLKDKDVIIPFIIGTQSNIRLFAKIASEICGPQKASCAIALFITRIKPSLDGKEPKIVEEEDLIPVISESPYYTPIV